MLGVCVGPSGLALVSKSIVESLSLVNGMAIAMIALTAGTELELKLLRPLMRTVTGVAVVGVLGTTLLLARQSGSHAATCRSLRRSPTTQAVIIAGVLGVVMVAQSPASWSPCATSCVRTVRSRAACSQSSCWLT